MTSDSGNSENRKAVPPVPIERRTAETGSPASENRKPSAGTRPSGKWTHYTAQSAIRSPGKLLRDIATDAWKGRGLAWRFFLRNIRGLYRQTLLGLFWAFLPPIANTAVWVFLKQTINLDTDGMGVHSTVYFLTGMILWQAFIDAFQMPLRMLDTNRNMICKLNFPREALLLVGIGEVIFDLLIRLLLLIPAFLWFGVAFHSTMMLAPLVILGLIALGMGLGLLIMPWGSLYQDVGRFIAMALPLWMIITPIIYPPLETYPGSLLNWLNPASPLLILARDWLLLGTTTHLESALFFGLVSIPLVLLGLVVYRISIPVLVERMTA